MIDFFSFGLVILIHRNRNIDGMAGVGDLS